MQESGIQSVFQQIYAELSAPAIPSGKEMSRGKRVAEPQVILGCSAESESIQEIFVWVKGLFTGCNTWMLP